MAGYRQSQPSYGSLPALARTEPATARADSSEPHAWVGPSDKRRAGPRDRPGTGSWSAPTAGWSLAGCCAAVPAGLVVGLRDQLLAGQLLAGVGDGA